jgi:hypothetical protein
MAKTTDHQRLIFKGQKPVKIVILTQCCPFLFYFIGILSGDPIPLIALVVKMDTGTFFTILILEVFQ